MRRSKLIKKLNFVKILTAYFFLVYQYKLFFLRSVASKGRYTCDVLENCPIFKTPTSLVQLCPKFLHFLDLEHPISNKPPSPNNNQSIKRKHNPRMTITKNIRELLHVIRSFLQVGFRFQYQLINLVLLSIDFFSSI